MSVSFIIFCCWVSECLANCWFQFQMVARCPEASPICIVPQCHGVLPSNRARNSPLLGRGRPSRIVCTGSAMLDSDPCSKFSLRSMSLREYIYQLIKTIEIILMYLLIFAVIRLGSQGIHHSRYCVGLRVAQLLVLLLHYVRILANLVQPLGGHSLHGLAHQRILVQNAIEMIHAQRE